MDFKDNVAIVTGSSKGIGKGMAKALAIGGTKVYLVARGLEKLQETQAEIPRSEYRSADITKDGEVEAIIDEVYEKEGRLDIFVNNAGGWVGQSIGTPWEEIRKLIELDMIAPLRIAHYLAQKFKDIKDNPLKVLTVASQAAVRIMPYNAGYNPAKMGLTGGIFSLQGETERLNHDHIKFYRLYPNTVGTEDVIAGIKEMREKGEGEGIEDPTTLESVVDTAIDLLLDKTPTKDARIGYYPGKGIVRTYFPSNSDEFYNPPAVQETVIDANFDPENLLK
jgi:short-subunit dehydrogenase